MEAHLEYKLKNTLFIDIETYSQHQNFSELSTAMKKLWSKKAGNLKNEEKLTKEELYFDRAALFPEFGSILCIGIGGVVKGKATITSIYENTESATIAKFFDILAKYPPSLLSLVAHNGKEFDYPYICKRAVINSIPLPPPLQFSGKKPWEIIHQDTLDMWRFGDFKSYTSLELLCEVLCIESPKDGIDGSMVNHLFWEKPNIDNVERILEYCKQDVLATMQVWLKMGGHPTIEKEMVNFK